MPKPRAICLEDLGKGASPRYLRCVAVSGREPGLRLDGTGTVLWKSDDGASCELWVSADERLILYRRADGVAVRVRSGGRSLDVPAQKPVVLLDQDGVEVGGREFRIHVHGLAPRVHAPSPLPDPTGRGVGRVAATAAALGAVLGAADCKKADAPGAPPADGQATMIQVPAPGSPVDGVIYVPADPTAADAGEIEVRETPPEMKAEPPEPSPVDAATALDASAAAEEAAPDAGSDPSDGAVDVFELDVSSDAAEDSGRPEPRDSRAIEVRVHPPRPVIRHDDPDDLE